MPKDKKDSLLKQLNEKIDAFNKTSKRKLFLDSVAGALGGSSGLGAAALGAGAGMAMATMGAEAERLELQRLEGELRSMKFRMMMKMGERGQEVSNLEVKLHDMESHINDLSETISSKLYELNAIIMRASLPHPAMNNMPGAMDFPEHMREHLYGKL
jgi:hypothetical protein